MKRDPESGTVLLTTLLIMALMATLAVALMDDVRLAVKRTITVDAYAQADWQLRGAQAFVSAWVKNDFAQLPEEAKTALLRSPDPLILPTPGGMVSVRLRDASQCFNLNALVTEAGVQDDTARLEFVSLLQVLGLPDNLSEALSWRLVDWMDADSQRGPNGAEDGTYLRRTPPYRTANTALMSPDELLAIEGVDAEIYALLKPFICTGAPGAMPKINVNTLPPERLAILTAALGGRESVPFAQAILEDRGVGTYDDLTILNALNPNPEDVLRDRFTTETQSLLAEVVVTQVRGATTAERVRVLRYDGVDTGALKLTYRGWGRAAFLPDFLEEGTAE